ncbi:hypothetical protein G5714_011566 [Onychostoma macrolepis]|uniref:Uncharacterized protein n=1 Tax=Onychostoma macrolepis TaxID=369639 RepID=A0A7J6CN56_9TELE|nr:hypothetical protein G5714_011566 [Onychostoma macrolepis]
MEEQVDGEHIPYLQAKITYRKHEEGEGTLEVITGDTCWRAWPIRDTTPLHGPVLRAVNLDAVAADLFHGVQDNQDHAARNDISGGSRTLRISPGRSGSGLEVLGAADEASDAPLIATGGTVASSATTGGTAASAASSATTGGAAASASPA